MIIGNHRIRNKIISTICISIIVVLLCIPFSNMINQELHAEDISTLSLESITEKDFALTVYDGTSKTDTESLITLGEWDWRLVHLYKDENGKLDGTGLLMTESVILPDPYYWNSSCQAKASVTCVGKFASGELYKAIYGDNKPDSMSTTGGTYDGIILPWQDTITSTVNPLSKRLLKMNPDVENKKQIPYVPHLDEFIEVGLADNGGGGSWGGYAGNLRWKFLDSIPKCGTSSYPRYATSGGNYRDFKGTKYGAVEFITREPYPNVNNYYVWNVMYDELGCGVEKAYARVALRVNIPFNKLVDLKYISNNTNLVEGNVNTSSNAVIGNISVVGVGPYDISVITEGKTLPTDIDVNGNKLSGTDVDNDFSDQFYIDEIDTKNGTAVLKVKNDTNLLAGDYYIKLQAKDNNTDEGAYKNDTAGNLDDPSRFMYRIIKLTVKAPQTGNVNGFEFTQTEHLKIGDGSTDTDKIAGMFTVPDGYSLGNAIFSINDGTGKFKIIDDKLYFRETLTEAKTYALKVYIYDDSNPSRTFSKAIQVIVEEETVPEISDGWIIVSPEPNIDGWNKETVTISLSQTAKDLGYSKIEVVNDVGIAQKEGASIVYDSETNGVTPIIKLKKGSTCTNTKTVRTIRIDLTKPTASLTVENETIWAKNSKKVTITPSDTFSGIASVSVKHAQGKTYTPVKSANDYTFDADLVGEYTITISDVAGNETEIKKTIENIDISEIILTAIPGDLTHPEPVKNIAVTRDPGTSGIKTFILYYKEQAGDTYEKLDDLDQSEASFTYAAEMNGYFKFELVNNAGDSKSVEVLITNVNPPVPVTKISAVYVDDPDTAYSSNTWTNHDILLTLTNANAEITDPVKWKISEDNGVTWNDVSDHTKTVTTSDVLNKTYQFKGYVTKAGGDIEELSAKKFTVKIDKTKPLAPAIKDAEKYNQDTWFKEDVKLEASVEAKPGNADIRQDIYVCTGNDCDRATAQWVLSTDGTKKITENGSYVYYFKTVDEAGNESAISDPVYVNINDSVPEITIRLNTNPIKELINGLTFGFFFKDTVDIDFSADFAEGDIYYIINTGDAASVPADNDERWRKGTSTSLAPDAKAMIYVKAVSKAGVIGRESSIFNVYADASAPEINLPADATTWTKETTMEVEITDAVSGVDKNSVTYAIDGGVDTNTNFQNDKITISGLKDGSYRINVKASDNSGNPTSKHTLVKIDHTKPVIGTPIADTTDYAKNHTITFHTSDALSGLEDGYPKVDGESIEPKEDGSYSIKTDTNKTYTIVSKDKAGNEHSVDYVENKIDTTAPGISNKVVENESEYKTHKKVSFDAIDNESGIDTVTVTYIVNGVTKNVNVQVPTAGNTYSFTANEASEYTITVTDQAGNSTSDTVQVENIDPDGIKIINISDTTAWAKDEMDISFEIQTGTSGLKDGYPTITCPDQSNIILTKTGNTYHFTAKANSRYTITAKNTSDDEVSEELDIAKIDFLAPTIEDVSENATASDWRAAPDITFHVYDYNDEAKTSGSGMKSGYPKVYYMDADNQRIDVQVTQDPTDVSLYTFKAEKNTTYTVEAMDAVEHPPVEEHIIVDHVLEGTMVSDIQVKAENDTKEIASGTWVKGEILFTVQGGLEESVLENYQLAVTDGEEPAESDWMDMNMSSTNQHKVTGNEKGKHYFFRAVPAIGNAKHSEAFVVNLDNEKPTETAIHLTKKNSGVLARLVNALSFGNWMKEAQNVSFTASDNFSGPEELRYEYMEEKDGVKGNWTADPKNLSYEDSDIILYAKAIDLAGNESDPVHTALQIDTIAPEITGVQDQKEYKQYYVPRTVTITDNGSGLKEATYTKDKEPVQPIDGTIKFKNTSDQAEVYVIHAEDYADNTVTLTFKLVPLPNIETEIDGSDESKDIIDQVQKELDEEREHLAPDEIKDYEKWIDDAQEKWDKERKKILEDENTGTKVEGEGETSFDPNTVLIVDEIDESKIPTLPRKAIYVYDVYMKKGETVIQPDGSVKVYLPYDEKEEPIIYEIDEDGNVKEINGTKENGYVTFITDTLKKYAISNKAQEENKKPEDNTCTAGPDGELGTKDDVCGNGSSSEEPVKKPDGSVEVPNDGSITFPDGNEIETPDGGIIHPDGSVTLPDGTEYDKDGNKKPKDPKPDPDDTNPQDKPKTCELNDGETLNVDTDGDRLPDINLDSDKDCVADLNLDIDGDLIPDINIDSRGSTAGSPPDGKADINIDNDGDGYADVNIMKINKWIPNKDVTINGFSYDTMTGLQPDLNIDTDGDGTPDRNVDTDKDGLPDVNVDDDWFTKRGIKDPNRKDVQGSYDNAMGGANTGDVDKWTIWWIILVITGSTMTYSVYRERKKRS